jgi:hypothetical protein
MSEQQVPVLLLDMSGAAHVRLRLQHLSEQHEPVLHMDVSKPQVPELHLSESGQQEPISATGSVYTTGSLAVPGLFGTTKAAPWRASPQQGPVCLDNCGGLNVSAHRSLRCA